MKDSQLKWANCCKASSACIGCIRYKECATWFQYVDGHRKSKSYAHFDRRTSLENNNTRCKVMNPIWVSHHGFWPLIEFEKSKNRYVGEKKDNPAHLIKKKPRVIRYCSHIDRCIYQRYSFLLDQRYNQETINKGIDAVAVAYRTNKSFNNLHLAKRALDFIEKTQDCLILVSDFSSFFDQIDHELLKNSLCNLLGVEFLPDDYYAVFKNTVGYSSWSWNSIMKYWRRIDPDISRRLINSKDIVLPQDVYHACSGSEIHRNREGIGIPQGSPISAILSNVYMMDFDEKVNHFVGTYDGLYMRYCDDLLIVLPEIDRSIEDYLINKLLVLITNHPGVEIQNEKTSILKYEKTEYGASLISMNAKEGQKKENVILDYLGVTFDGINRKIRPRSISKYHYRLYKKAATIARQNKGRRNIYGIYSEKAKSISGKRSFVDYAKDAKNVLNTNDPEADSIINHNMEKIAKAINKKKRSFG